MLKNIINFLTDIPAAVVELGKFISSFFEMIINIINIMPDPFNKITLLGIGVISTIYVVKVVRG